MNRSRPLAALALVTCFATLAHAQDLDKPDVKLIGIEEHHLPNGLRIVFLADPTKPTFTTNLTVLVGSVHEGAGETGMAHVFEHILFRSAEGFPDISETLKELGGNFNGTTSFDRTNFFETLNATDENFETAIRLEAARLGRVTISEDFLEKEGRIVESEFDLGESSAQRVLLFGAFGAMFDFHGYSRSPIGTVEDFKSLTVKGVKAFYKRYYRPDNAVLFITGKFDRARAMELVKKHFGGFKASGKGRPTYTTREPAARGERRYTVRGPGDTSHVLMAYRAPGAASPEAAAAQVLAQALVAGKSGPLYDAIVGAGLASSVEGGMMTLRMPSPLLFMAEVPKDKDPAAVEAALIEELEKKAAQLPEADLVRAKSQIEREFDDAFNSAEAMAMVLSEYEASGSWQLFVVRREQVKAMTLEAVRAVAAKYLRVENRVVGRYMPDPAAVKVRPDPEPEVGEYSALLAGVPAGLKGTKEFAYTPATRSRRSRRSGRRRLGRTSSRRSWRSSRGAFTSRRRRTACWWRSRRRRRRSRRWRRWPSGCCGRRRSAKRR